MVTDVDVQYLSHLNGLVLGNNWGDMIRLLDTCLVNGLLLSSITSAKIDPQGDIALNLFADHNCLLFQIVELAGFEPAEINGKYRIKGAPNTKELILKALHLGKVISKVGTAKLASLGYEIAFRDSADVKRAYRAKNPRSEHPYIRVDESLTSPDGVSGIYTSSYAKFAMVGLLEDMKHIDDYHDTSKVQLPLDTTDSAKNWKITGTGTGVKRGWAHWYWATNNTNGGYIRQNADPLNGNRKFTLTGNSDAFYLNIGMNMLTAKAIWGCGLFETAVSSDNQWFLMSGLTNVAANADFQIGVSPGFSALTIGNTACTFQVSPINYLNKNTVTATPIVPDFLSGSSNLYSGNNISALQIPFQDSANYLRGCLKHVCYMGKSITSTDTTPIISDASMYVTDNVRNTSNNMSDSALGGGLYFYLGEIE